MIILRHKELLLQSDIEQKKTAQLSGFKQKFKSNKYVNLKFGIDFFTFLKLLHRNDNEFASSI